MSALRDLQQGFAGAVLDDASDGFDQAVIANGLTGARRLQIYHNNFYISLTDALVAVYPVISRLVGDEFFRYMARAYIQAHPSVSGNLHDFGDQFALFINGFAPASELVYLSDVAKLEWAYHVVFHAAECAYFDVAKLHQISEQQYEQLTFSLNPASRLLTSDYPILTIWQANQADNFDDSGIDLNTGGSKILVIRRNRQVEFESLSNGEYVFLEALAQGINFSTACKLSIQADPECTVEQYFQNHVQAKTIIDFVVEPYAIKHRVLLNKCVDKREY